MRRVVTFFAALFFACASSYCAPIGRTDKEVKKIAGPILANILDGMKNNDIKKFCADFDKGMLDAFPPKKAAGRREIPCMPTGRCR